MMQIMRADDATMNSIVPAHGQPAYGLTTHTLKIGDGVTTWENLPKVGEALQNEDYKIHYKEIPENSNLNSYTESGYYYSQSENITEKPYNVPKEFILVVTSIPDLAQSQCTQYIKSIENNWEYVRTYVNDEWTPWCSKLSVDNNNNLLQPLVRTYRQSGASSLGCKYGSEDSDSSLYMHADINTKARGIYDTDAGIIVAVSNNRPYYQGIWDGDPVDVSKGGTGGTDVFSARAKLNVPGQMGVQPDMGLPIGYGLLSNRGSLGNTINTVPSTDNYYYGADMNATLWGGAQVNGATFPTFYPAMMMNGEQRFQLLWSGSLYNGNSTTLADGYKYALLLIGAVPNGTTSVITSVPAGLGAMRILGVDGYYLDIALEINNPAINLRVYGGNNSAGRITYVWGILKHTV